MQNRPITIEHFIKAAQGGDLNTVTAYINAHNDNPDALNLTIDGIADEKQTALYRACHNGHTTIVIKLIKAGASIDVTVENSLNTPLYAAISNNKHETACVLIELSANPNQPNQLGTTPLILAAMQNNTALSTILLESGAEVDATNKNGDTALYTAAEEGHSILCKILMKYNASLCPNNFGRTPLVIAREEECTNVVSVFHTPLQTLPTVTMPPTNRLYGSTKVPSSADEANTHAGEKRKHNRTHF